MINNNDFLEKLYNKTYDECDNEKQRSFFYTARCSSLWENLGLSLTLSYFPFAIATIVNGGVGILLFARIFCALYFGVSVVKKFVPNKVFKRCDFFKEFRGESFGKVYGKLFESNLNVKYLENMLNIIKEAIVISSEGTGENKIDESTNVEEEIKQSEERLKALFSEYETLFKKRLLDDKKALKDISLNEMAYRSQSKYWSLIVSFFVVSFASSIIFNAFGNLSDVDSNILYGYFLSVVCAPTIGVLVAYWLSSIFTTVKGHSAYKRVFKKMANSLGRIDVNSKYKDLDESAFYKKEDICGKYTDYLNINFSERKRAFLEQAYSQELAELDSNIKMKASEIKDTIIYLQQLNVELDRRNNSEAQTVQRVPSVDRTLEQLSEVESHKLSR